MNEAFRLFKRGNRFYIEDTVSGKQTSLRTSDAPEARRLLAAKNEAARVPILNLSLARTYLAAHDPALIGRTWREVMAQSGQNGRQSSRERYARAVKDRAFDSIRDKPLIQTTADDFLRVLREGGNTTNHFLRRLHNLAVGLGWLLAPVLHPKHWPKIKTSIRRAITAEEHRRILEAEGNEERRLYYRLLWETGGSQTDVASLTADHIDWKQRLLVFHRRKLAPEAPPAQLSIGASLEAVLLTLPEKGPLFPSLAKSMNKHRSAEFSRRCRILKITGISLHSYRYAWAERAFASGYPERFAMANLGHSSQAIHRAYSRKAFVVCPPLETYLSTFPKVSNSFQA
jgi:integrase